MIQHLLTSILTVHPAAQVLPKLAEDSPEFRAMEGSIAEAGILEPLQVSKGRVVDGRDRLRIALRLGYETLPCIEIPESQVASVILHTLVARKHYSKSALAYLAFPHMETALAESKKRRLENLRHGKSGPDSSLGELSAAKTAEDLAERVGIGKTSLFAARNIHGYFKKNAELKAHFEPLILSGELGLGAVLQGIAGWESTKGKPKGEREQLLLWHEKIKGFCDPRKFAGWEKLDPETKHHVREELIKGIKQAWPADLREAVLGGVL